ncbi:biotin/lipoyl-binding carrier protein [Castellaniella sp.]|uniref:biotin/lipoyl-binding carrier protein n=1 Tax=Castellaniella sp. TaxID=1955812 RepID=UPI00356933C0
MTTIDVRAEMNGIVARVLVEKGRKVNEGDELMILESMKMEIPLIAPCDGVLLECPVSEDDAVDEGQLLAVIGC